MEPDGYEGSEKWGLKAGPEPGLGRAADKAQWLHITERGLGLQFGQIRDYATQ